MILKLLTTLFIMLKFFLVFENIILKKLPELPLGLLLSLTSGINFTASYPKICGKLILSLGLSIF
jgi:hypothetical protein